METWRTDPFMASLSLHRSDLAVQISLLVEIPPRSYNALMSIGDTPRTSSTAAFFNLLARCFASLGWALLATSAAAQAITPICALTNTGFSSPRNPTGGSLLLGPDGGLYGTTLGGGSGGFGTIFRVTTNGTFNVLVAFDSFNTGGSPVGGVTLAPDGNLYGTARVGGRGNGTSGTVFRATRDGSLNTLYTFSARTWNGSYYVNSDGAYPYAAVMLAPDGYLYGTTSSGGANGSGTVFKLSTDGILTTLFSFDALVSSSIGSTNLYGAQPWAGLTWGPDGNLYGTAVMGGTKGSGTAFRITPSGAFTLLTNFVGINGDGPEATMTLGPDGCMYGTTINGGTNGGGTVFKLATDGALTVLAHLGNYKGAAPKAPVIFGPDGCLYGTTSAGGTNLTDKWGTVFRITTNGLFTTLADFWKTNGVQPESGVAFGPDGHLYGTTMYGGSADPNAAGEVYRLSMGLKATQDPPSISIARSAGGVVTLTVASTPGSTNRIWTGPTLNLPIAQWQALGTNVATNGVFQIIDTHTDGQPTKFYRASTP